MTVYFPLYTIVFSLTIQKITTIITQLAEQYKKKQTEFNEKKKELEEKVWLYVIYGDQVLTISN